MIVVDTAIWVETLRRPSSDVATRLRQLLDIDEAALALPVRLELMIGIASRHRRAFRRGLSALPVLRPTEDTWTLIEGWLDRAAEQGFHFSIPDLLIAALAEEIGGLVWARDADFQHMEKLGFVRLFE